MMFKKYLLIFEKKIIKIEKRTRLVFSVLILSLLMLFSTFFYFDKVLFFLPLLIFFSFILSYLAILEKVKKINLFGLFFIPIVLTSFFYLSYFLLPSRWLTRLPFIIFYAISYYGVLLSSNIFNIGVEKSLQLYRAAFSVNYFYINLISFLGYSILFSFKQIFFINGLGVGIISYFLSLQLYWSIKLKKNLEFQEIKNAFLTSLIMLELGVLVSFVPLKNLVAALFLTASFYTISGLIYHFLDEKLFKETIREYIFVFLFVLIVVLLSLNW